LAGNKSVYHVYPILTENRRELMESLNSRGIQTGIHYPYPVHLLPAHSDLGYKPGDFPVSENIAARELSLPMYPELTDTQIEAVTQSVSEFHGMHAMTQVSAAV
jgi:dTDP-4-amino-4,6-dideoxygalactose transaminase